MRTEHVEILAPAGSPEALQAAVAAGADAVYLGLKTFNARGNAVNFTTEELARYVPMAHEAGTRVYLTLNTLVKMNEMQGVLEALARAADCGIDGVILQDIGLARIMAHHFPKLRRHASTQLAVHNLEGVRYCVDQGFERVVLARELTLEEIGEIRAAFPPDVIQLEVFCHGAMCYTYSGMCFFSGSVGGRSGNRGECAYTCRKGYRILNETRFPMAPEPDSLNNYLFSMKDMNTLDLLPELVAHGVDSLKIEGRRKGPAYVGASVQAYREGLRRGAAPDDLQHDMQLAFGRSYTGAFYRRGQYGDAPIDLTTTGSVGVFLGEVGADGSFRLERGGPQQYDGLRLVRPDRTEALVSFKGFRVEGGDRFRPGKGSIIHLKEQMPAGTRVYWVHSQDVERRYRPAKQRPPSGGEVTATVDMHASLRGDAVDVTATCAYGEASVSLTLLPSDTGKTVPLQAMLFRFGDTAFLPGSWSGPPEPPGFLPPSALKKARRELLAELADMTGSGRAQALARLVAEGLQGDPVAPAAKADTWVVRLDRLDLLQDLLPDVDRLGLHLDVVMKATQSTPDWQAMLPLLTARADRVRLVLPMVLRRWDLRLLRRRLAALPAELHRVVLANPGHFPLLAEARGGAALEQHADFSLYHLNTWARKALEEQGINGRLTLSLEDDKPNMQALLAAADPSRFEVIAYTDTPLFVAEACSLAALYGGCPGTRVCGHETLHIENEHGDRFQVRHDRCRSTVIGDRALSWSGSLDWFKQRGVHHFRADFTTRDYSADQVRTVLADLLANTPVPDTHTENLERLLL